MSLFGYLTDYRLDLYKVWLNQSVSSDLLNIAGEFMRVVEHVIKDTAPGALYGEWAKKAECWATLKEAFTTGSYKDIIIKIPSKDIIGSNSKKRLRISDQDVDKSYYEEIESTIKNISPEKWKEIYLFCKENNEITEYYTTAVHNLGRKLKEGIRPTAREIIIVNELLTKIQFKSNVFDIQSSN